MTNKIFVPPLKIQGIKTKLVPLIREYVVLDQDTVWIEPFMGSGVVGFNIAPENAVFADTNPHIIEFYRQIQSGRITHGIVREFLEDQGAKLAQSDDAFYYEVRARFNREHDPLDFLFLNRACFNGMMRFNRDNEFNVPYGHKPQRFAKAYITKITNQVAYAEQKIHRNNWSFLCQSFRETIPMAGDNTFIYCDPPYIGRHVDYYDSWNEQLERELCQVLQNTPAKFMLSTWDHNDFRRNEYIDSVWGFCHKITQEHFYHLGAREKNRNPMVEALLTNYVPFEGSNRICNIFQQMSLF